LNFVGFGVFFFALRISLSVILNTYLKGRNSALSYLFSAFQYSLTQTNFSSPNILLYTQREQQTTSSKGSFKTTLQLCQKKIQVYVSRYLFPISGQIRTHCCITVMTLYHVLNQATEELYTVI